MAYEWERDEWWNALRHSMTSAHCPPGHHHMTPTAGGGGTCTNCTETIGVEEL